MKFFVSLSLAAVLFSGEIRASEGVTVRGGGDEIAFAFNESLHSALREIRQHRPDLDALVAPHALGGMPSAVTVYVVDQPLLVNAGQGEQESVAANDPVSRTIWIHRARWLAISSERLRQAIALHEYLSLKRVESTGRYPISMAFLNAFEPNYGTAVLLGAGTGEADLLQWRRQKIRCELRQVERPFRTEEEGDYLETDPVKLFVRTTTHTALQWRVAGRQYDMEFYLRSKVRSYPRNHGSILNLLMRQRVRAIEAEDADGALYLFSERTEAWDDWGYLAGTGETRNELRFDERVNEQERVEWTWERGRKRERLNRTVSTRLPDGSLRTVLENYHVPAYVVSSVTECTAKEVPPEEWIEPDAQASIEAVVVQLNESARLANETEKAFRDCNPDTCARLEKESRSALAKFEAGWDTVFAAAEKRNREAEAIREAGRKRLRDEWEAKKKAERQAAAEAIAAARKKAKDGTAAP